ncbi:MAG: prolyl oligopeptidase family serine peptidase [Gemmatimonadota bacterium]
MPRSVSPLVADQHPIEHDASSGRARRGFAWGLVACAWIVGLIAGWVGMFEPPFPMLILSFLAKPLLRTIPWVTVALLIASLIAMWLGHRFGHVESWLRRMSRGAVALAAFVLLIGWSRFQTGYATRSVVINASQAQLVGTLFAPRQLPAPGILLVHGSGRFDRHLYDWAALLLVRAGYAVLNVDKRGVGESGGFWRDAWQEPTYFRQMINDHVAAVEALSRQPEVVGQPVGMWGVSQAGWVIPEVAALSPVVRFTVTISGPTVPFGDEALFSRLAGDEDHFGWNPPLRPLAEIDAIVDTVTPSGPDPAVALTRVTVPGLWLYGAWDNSIPVAKSVQVLRGLIAAGKPFGVKVFPEANHGLMVTRGPHRHLPPRYADGVWGTMLQWMREHAPPP